MAEHIKIEWRMVEVTRAGRQILVHRKVLAFVIVTRVESIAQRGSRFNGEDEACFFLSL
jgi:hypothetical protein